jgi:flagellar hook-length control protein FliK
MSLPVQLPLLNTKQASSAPESKKVDAVDPAQPAKPRGQDDFDKAMKSADKARNEGPSRDPADPDEKTSTEQTAATDGNELPPEEAVATKEGATPVAPSTVFFVEETLKLQLGLNQSGGGQADEAVLLATQFVVDSLPTTVKETATELSLSGNITTGKPELLVRLQAQLNQTTGTQNPIQLNLDTVTLGSLRELAQVKEQVSNSVTAATQVESAAAQSNTAAELRATTLAAKPELVVPNRVGTEGWSEAMAGRVNLLVNQRISAARIHINPPELGPIEVRVNVNNDQASVQFTSQSAQVRDALEQSIPRLRDMLESAGFSLADSDVNDQGGQGEQGTDEEEGLEAADEMLGAAPRRETIGLVDDYV